MPTPLISQTTPTLTRSFAFKVVLNIPLGAVTDRRGRVATAAAGEAMAALGMLGTGFATNIATLLPCRLLVGAGAAASEAGTVAYLADLTEQPRLRPHRGVIIGLKSSCGAAAWCAGPAIGGFLGSAFGAPAAFFRRIFSRRDGRAVAGCASQRQSYQISRRRPQRP